MNIKIKYLLLETIALLFTINVSVKSASTDEIKDTNSIKKILLVFKTHLDIGFTNSKDSVIDTYMKNFIPNTLSLTESLRKNKSKEHYLWTTGSWLIYKFLEQSDSLLVKRMENAIKNGEIVWHAIPFSTHTELTDPSLYELGIQISKQLDKRFGINTIAAKMTDVPGHTRSIIPILARNGIKFLHIGVNSASTMPDVPTLFRWCSPDGSSIIVMYQQGYGNQFVLPGTDVMVDIRFTNDNHGPHSISQIKSIYKELNQKYPNAEILAATLNDVASEVLKIQDKLPCIKKEIGDTWIHGVGSDPLLDSEFRALSRLRLKWIKEGKFKFGDKQDMAFGLPLLMIAEHTWGRDVKTFLKDWNIYLPKDFEKARSKSNFKLMEQSWNDKREYIQQAVNSLPPNEKNEALEVLKSLKPSLPPLKGYSEFKNYNSIINTKYFEFKINTTNGSIIYLKDKETGKSWANKQNPMFMYSYQTFSNLDYNKFQNQYLTKKVQWALYDFGKPGIEKLHLVSKIWEPTLCKAYYKKNRKEISILLKISVLDEYKRYIGGSPTNIYIELIFPNKNKEIQASLKWFGKRAYRLPEASWFSFIPLIAKSEWYIDKMGCMINSQDIVSHGNRKMHACIKGVQLKTDQAFTMSINSVDAPLAMFGNTSLLDFNDKLPDPKDGVHFCLHNNIWGTNFRMWFDDNMQFRFIVRL